MTPGLFWGNAYWVDRFLSFGLRTAPYIFDLFANALTWMLLSASWLVLNYLDDFIAFLPPSADLIPYENYFEFLCKTLGISNNEKKKKKGQVVTFLGIELDSVCMEARLPSDKLEKARLWVARMLNRDVIDYNDLHHRSLCLTLPILYKTSDFYISLLLKFPKATPATCLKANGVGAAKTRPCSLPVTPSALPAASTTTQRAVTTAWSKTVRARTIESGARSARCYIILAMPSVPVRKAASMMSPRAATISSQTRD